MNQKRKRLGLWILFLAALLLTQFTVPVKASEPQIQDVNIQMVGGQIRTIDPMGLRMVACIKKSYIQELEKSGATVSYGIVLLPKKYLTEGQALTLDGKYLYNGSVYKPAKVPAVKKFSEDNDRIYFTAVLANLPKERYKNDYAARAYAEITRTVTEDDGKKKTTTEVVYSESEIDRQVYRIAEEAVNGTTETEETKQWLQDNILAPVDKPEELPEEEKKISFRLGKVSGVTLYHKTTSEAVKKEDYLVKVEMEDQPEIFAVITEVIAPQTETGKVSFKLDRKDYTTSQAGQTIEGAVVEFGTKSNDKVSTKYITMQSLIDQMKANPGGTYTLEHDIDASMVQGDDYLVPTFSGTFNGNGYKIKGLTTTLFGTVSGGKVQNVKLENVSITKVNSYKDAGGGTIANKAQKDAVIENVHVSGSLKSTNSRELLGGLVGRMDYAKVSKCSANLEITGSFNTTGGLIGQMSNQNEGPNIVENSYAVGSIRGNRTNGALGGLIGWHNCKTNFSVTNCYAAINMELTGTNRQPGGFIGYIGEADATGVLKSNVSYSTGNAGYKFDGSTETIKYTTAQIENLYSLRESRLKRESSRTGNTNLTQITDVTVDKLSQKEFYTNMGWSEDVWDFAPLKEGKTPILRNNDSNMTTMLQTKEIASAADLKNIKNDLSGVYVLTTDIDISESASGTAVIPGIFKGTLKGNGHQIIGQKIPLFDTLDGATIENVKLVQGEINQKGTDKVAALAKTSQADTLIKDVYVRDMSVTGQSNVAGLVASMNKTTVEECSVNATVNGKRAGGFAAEILGDSVVKNSYARRTADKETFAATEGDLQGGFAAVIKKSELINNFSELTLSQKAEEKPEEIPKKSSEKAAKTACMVGNFVAESGVGSEAVTKAEHNISFGPKEYSFAGNSTAENVLTNYTENYEYTGSVSNDEGTQTPEHTGKIDKATAAQITNKTFYIDTLKWDEKIWYLDDVAGGKRPRLKAEGDVYGAEEEDTSKGEGSEGDSNNAPSEEVVYIQAPVQDEETEEPQMAGETPTEVISFIAQKNAEEIAAMDSLESVKDYQADRKLIYENLRLFMPFYTYEQIVKDGNKVDPSHVLNKKTVLAVYPMDDRGNRIVALSDKTVQDIKKIRIQFTDETTPLIYNITYIDNCGRFRVRHFGVATAGRFSSFAILKQIRDIVRRNRDIKVWNLSLGSAMEIDSNFISPEAAELDKIQYEYDVIFVIAGTNKKRNSKVNKIGAPADSLNSLVVNAVDFSGNSASYTRRGPVLSFFYKPDVCYYGGDGPDKIVVCEPLGKATVTGTSFAAPWITRKMAYLIHVMGLSREVAKALIIDSAAGWNRQDNIKYEKGYGIVPKKIEDILYSRDDEIRFIMSGNIDEYEVYTYNIPVPQKMNAHPFFAKATLAYFPQSDRNQGVDYTSTEMDIHFGRIKGQDEKAVIKAIDYNKQAEEGLNTIYEEDARKLYRKWDNVKHISEALKENGRPRKVYQSGLWGLSIKTKERLDPKAGRGLRFGIVVTLREMNGENRIDDFIKMCMMRGWIVNRLDVQAQADVYFKAEEEITFE